MPNHDEEMKESYLKQFAGYPPKNFENHMLAEIERAKSDYRRQLTIESLAQEFVNISWRMGFDLPWTDAMREAWRWDGQEDDERQSKLAATIQKYGVEVKRV